MPISGISRCQEDGSTQGTQGRCLGCHKQRPGGQGQASSAAMNMLVTCKFVPESVRELKSLQEVRGAWSKSCINIFGLQCFKSWLLWGVRRCCLYHLLHLVQVLPEVQAAGQHELAEPRVHHVEAATAGWARQPCTEGKSA